jgi:hypothetical protein
VTSLYFYLTKQDQVMTRDFPAGNYRFIPAVFQYSSGVAADPDFEIERVRFDRPVPLADGFSLAADFILAAERPLTAFCACELRSPAAFTEDGFRAFNESYVVTLRKWGLFDGTINPVARSNVCPEIAPPSEPSFHAFSYTVPAERRPKSFIISGSGEAREGGASYRERTVRRGDVRPGDDDAALDDGGARRVIVLGPPRLCAAGG